MLILYIFGFIAETIILFDIVISIILKNYDATIGWITAFFAILLWLITEKQKYDLEQSDLTE
jgi:hypothetical protein